MKNSYTDMLYMVYIKAYKMPNNCSSITEYKYNLDHIQTIKREMKEFGQTVTSYFTNLTTAAWCVLNVLKTTS